MLHEDERTREDRHPRVSIIMGAYNAEKTLREALDSILAQDFTSWEFIICDDASSDRTLEICETYATNHPSRFKILSNERNLKLPATLNRCLAVATGDYVARMDADDISSPDRLTKQIALLDSEPSIGLVGTAMRRFDDTGPGGVLYPPEKPNRYTLHRATPFYHATIVARREVYEQIGGYTVKPRTARGQDIDLWFKFFDQGLAGLNILEPLYCVREDLVAIQRRTPTVRWNSFRTKVIGYRQLGYPLHWYTRPVLQLSKVLVPFKAQHLYRRWQKRQASDKMA